MASDNPFPFCFTIFHGQISSVRTLHTFQVIAMRAAPTQGGDLPLTLPISPSLRDGALGLITSIRYALALPLHNPPRHLFFLFVSLAIHAVLLHSRSFSVYGGIPVWSRRVLGTPCSESISVVSLHTLGLVDTWWQPHTRTNEECWIYPLGPNVRSFL